MPGDGVFVNEALIEAEEGIKERYRLKAEGDAGSHHLFGKKGRIIVEANECVV